jgi:DNA-binding MarR family transcriptional regulator
LSATDKHDVAAVLRGVLRLSRRLRSERPPGGITSAAVGLLGTLRRLGPMPAARLAQAEGLRAQSLSRLIARLERAGCIARTRDAADRRLIAIALTERGREVLAADMSARRRWLKAAMAASLTKAERRRLVAAARLMLKLARR